MENIYLLTDSGFTQVNGELLEIYLVYLYMNSFYTQRLNESKKSTTREITGKASDTWLIDILENYITAN